MKTNPENTIFHHKNLKINRLIPSMLSWLAFGMILFPGSLTAQNFWQPTGGPLGSQVNSLSLNGLNGKLYAGCNGVFELSQGSSQWTNLNIPVNGVVNAVVVSSSGILYAGTGQWGVYQYSGASWSPVNSGFPGGISIRAFTFDQSNVLHAATNQGVWSFSGGIWTVVGSIPDQNVFSLTLDVGGRVVAGTNTGVFIFSGVSWINISAGLPALKVHKVLYDVSSNAIYAGLDSTASMPGGLYKYSASNWTLVGGLTGGPAVTAIRIKSAGVLMIGTSNFCTGYSTYGYEFANNNWTQFVNGLPKTNVYDFTQDLIGNIFMACHEGVYTSPNGGIDWWPVHDGMNGMPVNKIDVNSHGHLFASTPGSGVFKSMDYGNTWQRMDVGLDKVRVNTLAVIKDTLYASSGIGCNTKIAGTYRSADLGASWTEPDPFFRADLVTSYTRNPKNLTIYATAGWTGPLGVASILNRTTNNGNSWTPSSITTNGWIGLSMGISPLKPDTMFVGTENQGLFRTVDGGGAWTQIPVGSSALFGNHNAFAFNSAGRVFVSKSGGGVQNATGVWHSTDNGQTWTQSGLNLGNDIPAMDLLMDKNDTLYIATPPPPVGNGVFILFPPLYNNPQTRNSGLNAGPSSFVINPCDGKLYVATGSGGVYKSAATVQTPSGCVTGLNSLKEPVSKFTLYPNPGNGNVKLMNSGSYRGKLLLTVLNRLGQEINTFSVNADRDLIEFPDMGLLPSGIYFVRIQPIGSEPVILKMITAQ